MKLGIFDLNLHVPMGFWEGRVASPFLYNTLDLSKVGVILPPRRLNKKT